MGTIRMGSAMAGSGRTSGIAETKFGSTGFTILQSIGVRSTATGAFVFWGGRTGTPEVIFSGAGPCGRKSKRKRGFAFVRRAPGIADLLNLEPLGAVHFYRYGRTRIAGAGISAWMGSIVTPSERLSRQIAFLLEADKLKNVLRQTSLMDSSRQENSAEHSWHLVLAATVLREHAPSTIDVVRVLQILTVHDLVEIDAGDTFAYDAVGLETKVAREQAAADRLFGLLPADQAEEFRALWEEFEAQETVESSFANALDRLQPLLQNAGCGGGTWRSHNLTREAVLDRMAPVRSGLPNLWPTVLEVIDAFCAAGVLRIGDGEASV